MGTREDKTYFNEGSILRYEDGHLTLIPDGLKQARRDYGLSETQVFLGMVGKKVFYFDPMLSDRILFFEAGLPDKRFEVAVPLQPWWPKKWKLAHADQVFEGTKSDEVLVYVWVKNTAWLSAYSKDAMGVPVDLKTAKPISSGAK
jgi:hypothetical protein